MIYEPTTNIGKDEITWLDKSVSEVTQMAAYVGLSVIPRIPIAIYSSRSDYAAVNNPPEDVYGNSPRMNRVEIVSPFAHDNPKPLEYMDKLLLHEVAHVLTAAILPQVAQPDGYCEWFVESIALFLGKWNQLAQPPETISNWSESNFQSQVAYFHVLGFFYWKFIEHELGYQGVLNGINKYQVWRASELISDFDNRWRAYVIQQLAA